MAFFWLVKRGLLWSNTCKVRYGLLFEVAQFFAIFRKQINNFETGKHVISVGR
jgi:hypothetical protein